MDEPWHFQKSKKHSSSSLSAGRPSELFRRHLQSCRARTERRRGVGQHLAVVGEVDRPLRSAFPCSSLQRAARPVALQVCDAPARARTGRTGGGLEAPPVDSPPPPPGVPPPAPSHRPHPGSKTRPGIDTDVELLLELLTFDVRFPPHGSRPLVNSNRTAFLMLIDATLIIKGLRSGRPTDTGCIHIVLQLTVAVAIPTPAHAAWNPLPLAHELDTAQTGRKWL